jgi:conjugal transfer pilus assembly protein TraE
MKILGGAEDIRKSLVEAVTTKNVVILSNLMLSTGVLIFAVRFALFEPGSIALPNAPITDVIEVRGSWANASFKKGHAIAFAELIGNISNSNINFVKERFLASATPHLREQFQEEIDRQIAIINARKLMQRFTIEDVYFDEYQDVVWIWGSREITLPGQAPMTKTWTYEFRVGVSSGMPKISYFRQYPGKPNTRQTVVPSADTIPELTENMREGLKESGSDVKDVIQ